MKLYYFDFSGRAEPCRIMLEAAGTEFEDLRFDQAKWAADYKAKSPTGQCPFLELDNGEILCQTVAISVYVANITGFMPSDAVKQARVLEMHVAFDDVRPSGCSKSLIILISYFLFFVVYFCFLLSYFFVYFYFIMYRRIFRIHRVKLAF
jgi:hypothetical protein